MVNLNNLNSGIHFPGLRQPLPHTSSEAKIFSPAPNGSLAGKLSGTDSTVVRTCLPPMLRGLGQYEIAAASGGLCHGTEGFPHTVRQEILWQGFFSDPTQWWDNRQDKKTSQYPDFTHKWSKKALWIDNKYKPAWVDEQLASWDARLTEPSVSAISGDEWVLGSSQERQVMEALKALDVMVQQEYHVDVFVYYGVLKRCIGKKDLALGRRLHALTIKSGCSSNAFLANHIIRMYATYGRLEEAMQVFNKVPAPDMFMWASIIKAHANQGRPERAIALYRQMRELAIKANKYVFVAVLKACAVALDLACGKDVHADFLDSAVEANDVVVGSCLVDMYAKCGSLQDACRVFDALQSRNVVTWTAMIAGFSQHGLNQKALSLYSRMQHECITPPNKVTFVCLLKACGSASALSQGQQLHAQILERGLEVDLTVGNSLVDMYGKCGSVIEARRVFDTLPTRDVVTWTAMIAGYAQHGLVQEAIELYSSMQRDAVIAANSVTFACLLQACASVGALHQGKEIHRQIQERGLEADVFLSSCLVDMYVKCKSLEEARKLFDNLPKKDVVAWTVMIAAYVNDGHGQEAIYLYARMQQEGLVHADGITFVCLLKACASTGALSQGKHLHSQIVERGLEIHVNVGNCLVDMYAKCGSLVDARAVFDSLPTRDVVTWNSLLNGYAEHGDGQMAMSFFEEMRQRGGQPNAITFISLLVACSHEGLVEEGQQYFRTMVQDYGIAPTIRHYNCMVDLLGRSGYLNEAEELLQTMPFESDVVGCTSLLTACKSHGDIERGRRWFDRLTALVPDNATAYVLLGDMYATLGRWKDLDMIEDLRKTAGAWKKPAEACIEVRNKVHKFTVGEEKPDISTKLKNMNSRLKQEGGHVPQTELVHKLLLSHGRKEDALCGHAEKLALAYGILNTGDGTPLLVTKNLRMCSDCHSTTKIMSRLENREVIVRDSHRVHHFRAGDCSCRDRL